MTGTHPIDPVNLEPIPPLLDSYTFHSKLPDSVDGQIKDADEGWIMGIDEAGRGRPMVYAAAYCPMSFKETLEEMGFDDSKALSADTRQSLWESFDNHTELCYSSTSLSPQAISAGMLRRIPTNLNRQAEDATVGLIQAAVHRGVNIKECYVDALGPAPQWQARLTAIFPHIKFTVCPKADSLFKIVGAASIVAKVTRDRYVHEWVDPEDVLPDRSLPTSLSKKRKVEDIDTESTEHNEEEVRQPINRGSGYPSDPKTQAFLKENIDPVFGYKGIVRFSWATIKVLLDKNGVDCKWIDDDSQPSALSYFNPDNDNAKPKIWKDLGISGVGEL
ncbi:ribonuclease HII [Kwoniella dejecticola CBS 10117]|uniref:Ribonuclease n=1 Tax=Kwoniella dejecticola CBS 10117 TaxID=1296121 RepID=A0A1A5ZYU9_9TREE|nr:ribonuclease HII [Kwoniella dejecticola CBS 10117]OBR82984.1 ribonuclease HII [Kwoniella dejecticola CBS 10117]